MEDLAGHSIKGYDLKERIGSGGFGAVYRAYQTTVNREVAIKIILPGFANQPDFIRRFEAEAQLVARLEHPYITPLYDYWRDPEGAYLVMRWLRGGSLRDALKNGPLDLPAAMRLMEQMTSALAVAHRSSVIHRDLKPANILLDEDGNAYLADFGIAKDLATPKEAVTHPDAIIGSPDYISPEQARSDPVTPRTDIYSLGVVLYEALTGQHPFPNLTAVERLYKHLNEPLPLVANLPDGVNEVIQKATAKNPAQRYADVLEMAAAWRAAVNVRPAENVVELLTLREQEILQRIVTGRSNKEIAQELLLTYSTVKWYVNQIFSKLGVRSRVQAIVRARELKLIVAGEGDTRRTTAEMGTTLMEPENPYKGLRAFQPADHQDFFGRERLVQKLVARLGEVSSPPTPLQEMERGEGVRMQRFLADSRFVAVVGPSGSGKSSVVKAGLIPALWRGDLPGSEKWFVVDMLPGDHPLDELEVALTRVASGQAGGLREQLERDERGLLRVAQLILPNDESELVVVVDQFEEVFTLVKEETERTQFLDLLRAAVTAPRSRVRVVITLRADFYDRPLRYPEFGELVNQHMETIFPLSADELERAIVQPAQRVGVTFESGLVATMVSDVNYQAGALPLLQYALAELFERRQERLLTNQAYRDIGGVIGALAKRADATYDSLTPGGQEAARQMFLRLVTLGEGKEDTRRRVARSELLALNPTSVASLTERGEKAPLPEGEGLGVRVDDLMDEIIDAFAAYRLLSLDNDPGTRTPTVEVAHEAILREWKRLRAWLEESREDIRWQRQLTAAAAAWENAGRDSSFLATGTRLEQFEAWASQTRLALTQEEREYLDASFEERLARRMLDQARKARESTLERRALNQLRLLVAVLLLATLGALGLSGIALNQRNLAQDNAARADAGATAVAQERDRSDSLRLAAAANTILNEDSGNAETAALLGIRALNAAYSPEADGALREATAGLYTTRLFAGHTGSVFSVAFRPDGRYALTGSGDGTARLWDVQTGQEVQTFAGHTGSVFSVAFRPDGRYALTGSGDGTARLWDVQTGETVHTFTGHTGGPVRSVVFSPDGRYALTGSGDGTARLWDVQTGLEVHTFAGHTNIVRSVVFSPDGRYALTGSDDSTARLWDVQTGETVYTFAGHTDWVVSVAFSPDGRYALTGGDKTARLWDVQSGQEVHTFAGHTDQVESVAFSPDGRYALTESWDHTARLWDVESGQAVHTFAGHTGWVWSVAFSPDGRYALTGSADTAARLWDVESGQAVHTFAGHTGGVTSVIFSPDGRYALTGSFDMTARLWDVQTGQEVRTFAGHTDQVVSVAFSPDGRYALTGSYDHTARLWLVGSPEQLVAYACTRVFRDFTDQERQTYSIPDDGPTCPQFTGAEATPSASN